MQMFVKIKVFDTLPGPADLQVREIVGAQIGKIMRSGKVASSGIFTDQRGGYFILNLQNGAEMMDLLDFPILTNCQVESHPVMSVEDLQKFFSTH
jgi:hypothetical protein